MRIKTLIEKAANAGFNVVVKDSHTIITNGNKSITIWEDKTIFRNDIPLDHCVNMRVIEAANYLKI